MGFSSNAVLAKARSMYSHRMTQAKYEELIHNGSEAMSYYETLFERPIEEQEYIREKLLKYCYLDTNAMVKVHEKLLEVCNNKIKELDK